MSPADDIVDLRLAPAENSSAGILMVEAPAEWPPGEASFVPVFLRARDFFNQRQASVSAKMIVGMLLENPSNVRRLEFIGTRLCRILAMSAVNAITATLRAPSQGEAETIHQPIISNPRCS